MWLKLLAAALHSERCLASCATFLHSHNNASLPAAAVFTRADHSNENYFAIFLYFHSNLQIQSVKLYEEFT
jgi:hypothetical protein